MPHSDRLEEDLKSILAKRKPKRIKDKSSVYTQASVLLPLFNKNSHHFILLIRRSTAVEYHKGEISFPGGAMDKSDNSPEHTAKRETYEEIGVKEKDIKILGQLDDITTATSCFIVHPFVGLVPFPYDFHINNREVDQLIKIPLQFFFDHPQPRSFTIKRDGEVFERPAFIYEDNIIWGATQRILINFITLIRSSTIYS
jgi:8-oxo-dGTP pyrophosphatase MutT (NUDIX family)